MNSALIQSDPSILMGKPVVAGTRITVELILEKLSTGETIEQILEAHPCLTREVILVTLGYAALVLSGNERSVIALDDETSDDFVAALDAPVESNVRLKERFARTPIWEQ